MSSVVCGRMITALCLFVAVESVGGALEAEKSKRMKSESMDRVDRYTIHVYNTRVNIDSYRALVKNLVLGYVHTTDAKKPEVLQLMGKILGFTEDELLGAMGRGGCLDCGVDRPHNHNRLTRYYIKLLIIIFIVL